MSTPKNCPTRILMVRTEYFEAEALWKKVGGIWSCVGVSSPEIGWKVGEKAGAVKLALLRMGAEWKFVAEAKVL